MSATHRSAAYRFTVPSWDWVNGEIVGLSKWLYLAVLNEARVRNKRPRRRPGAKCVVRRRYRGPRQPGRNSNSMCRKAWAKSLDVYIYEEIRL